MLAVHSNNEKKYLRCKRPLSLEDSLSVDKPSYSANKDATSARKRYRRGATYAWNVIELPSIPHFYIKEKTSVAVMNTKPQCVADRIVQCAKLLSVDCDYDDEKAGATLSINQMELCIQLFKVSDNTQNMIVVEIRRKNGSPISFHKVARAMLNAAKGNASTMTPSSTPKSQTMNLISHEETKEDNNVTVAGSIETIESLLRKDRVDAKLLGMESLLHLTTSGSSSKNMTLFTANVILNGWKNDIIKDTVFSLITKSNDNDEDESNNIIEDGFNQRMRIYALSLLANSLEGLAKSLEGISNNRQGDGDGETGDLQSKLSNDEWVEDGGILWSLVEILKISESSLQNLQEAYFAAKCLKTALEASGDLISWAIERKVVKVVEYSQKVGHCRHNLLGRASDELMLCLGRCTTSNVRSVSAPVK